MRIPRLLPSILWTLFTGGIVSNVSAQVKITGTVYDKSQQYAMPGVSVMGKSGAGTTTDSLGHYKIWLSATDSISFSYLGRQTAKIAVKNLYPDVPFDMSIQVYVDSLPTAFVRNRNYREDSLENRKEYAKIFDYSPDYVDNMKMGRRPGMAVGIDFDLLFSGKKVRDMEAFQKRLIEEEQDKYVDHRWSPSIVRKVTGLQSPLLDTFMRQYRPSYEFIQSCQTEYEFYKYIQDWGKWFSQDWADEHKSQKAQK